MVVFRRQFGNIRPVNRIKHVVDRQSAVAGGTVENTLLVQTLDTPTIADTDGCETGSKVNGIYLRVECVNTEATQGVLPNVYMFVGKNPGGNLTLPNPNVVGASSNKKYVIHQEMLMLQKQTGSNPRTLFNGVIMIPKLYRRNGPGDQLLFSILSPGVDIDYCVQCHYKEFR